jgi:ABC-type sugar transport system ATPase subunit
MTSPSTLDPPAIHCKGLSFRVGSTAILDQVDMVVNAGEFHALLGPSGSGKSTLLRLIAGLEACTQGSIELFGANANGTPAHLRRIAYVNQSASTYDHLSVSENLQSARALAQKGSKTNSSSLESELIDAFELRTKLHLKPPQLSGGQQQRLAILRALLSQRPLLLLDEPLAHLQESLKHPIRQVLHRWITRNSIACLYVTHDSQEASELAERISVIDQGHILQSGSPAELYRSPSCRTVAELFGRPCIEWFSIPHKVGLRPQEWTPHAFPTKLTGISNASEIKKGLTYNEAERSVVARGIIRRIRQIESSLWIELDMGSDLSTGSNPASSSSLSAHSVPTIVRPANEISQFAVGELAAFINRSIVELPTRTTN